MHEGVAKLLAHRAVEEEVDAVVDESEDVEQVAETGVHLVDEVVEQPVQQVHHALRELTQPREKPASPCADLRRPAGTR